MITHCIRRQVRDRGAVVMSEWFSFFQCFAVAHGKQLMQYSNGTDGQLSWTNGQTYTTCMYVRI